MKESDHNLMNLKLNLAWNFDTNDKDDRTEIYNFRNESDFKTLFLKTEENHLLKTCFDDPELDLDYACSLWLSLVNQIIRTSFRKIRINKQVKPKRRFKTFFGKRKI